MSQKTAILMLNKNTGTLLGHKWSICARTAVFSVFIFISFKKGEIQVDYSNEFVIVVLKKSTKKVKYRSSPNSNLPGPFLRKLPLIHDGMCPLMVLGMGSGVSCAELTRGAMVSSPLAFGHRCQLGTRGGDHTPPHTHTHTQHTQPARQTSISTHAHKPLGQGVVVQEAIYRLWNFQQGWLWLCFINHKRSVGVISWVFFPSPQENKTSKWTTYHSHT